MLRPDPAVVTAAPAKPADHPPVRSGRIGVLLMNLGTPEATDYWSMRRYLKEFLSDRRVIETNRLLWWPLLNGIILTTRPKRKGRDYDTVWNRERNEGPLKTITRSQAEQVGAAMQEIAGDKVAVDWSMRGQTVEYCIAAFEGAESRISRRAWSAARGFFRWTIVIFSMSRPMFRP